MLHSADQNECKGRTFALKCKIFINNIMEILINVLQVPLIVPEFIYKIC